MAALIMSTSPLVRTYTLQEFWELEEPQDHSRLELINGVLYMPPPPEAFHDEGISVLLEILRDHIRDARLGGKLRVPRASIYTSPNTYLEPDLYYLSPDLAARFRDRPCTTADLVVEYLSPSSERYDRTTKADTYGALGVRELWLIDEEVRTLEVRQQTGSGFGPGRVYGEQETVASTVFPELRFTPAAVFSKR